MSNSVVSIGLRGVQASLAKIGELAGKISSSSEGGVPEVEDLVQLKAESLSFKASAQVIKTGEELDETVLDILA